METITDNPLQEQAGKLARLMRGLGSITIIAAAASFLIQRWDGLQHLTRYFSFLGFTAILAGLGLYCGLRLRESKSARTLLALGGGLIVVNTAQLAALIYSYFSAGLNPTYYPDFLLWKAASLTECLLALGIGVPVLMLITIASFSVLAREIRTELILTAVFLNLALLIPVREPNATGLIAIAMSVALLKLHQMIKDKAVSKTFEGKIVQLHLLLPVLILIGRGSYLYQTTHMFIALLSFSIGIILFNVLPQLTNDEKLQYFMQKFSIIAVITGCMFFSVSIFETFMITFQLFIPVAAILLIGTLLVMSANAVGSGKVESRLAAYTGLLAIFLQLIIYPGILSFSFALLLSLVIACYGFTIQHRTFFMAGLSGFAFCLLRHMKFALELGMLNPWICLAILGTATIVAAAYAEKYFPLLLKHFSQIRSQVAEWK